MALHRLKHLRRQTRMLLVGLGTTAGALLTCGIARAQVGPEFANPLANAELFRPGASDAAPGPITGGSGSGIPGDTVPPGGGDTGSGGPPGSSGPDAGGGVPGSGPGGPGSGVPPGGAGGGQPGPASNPITGSDLTSAPSFDWRTLWDLHRRRFLDRAFSPTVRGASTGSSSFFLGLGDREEAPPVDQRIEDDAFAGAVPVLFELAAAGESNPVRLEALLALGRAAERMNTDQRAHLEHVLRAGLADGSTAVSEASAIAMGMAAGDGFAAVLVGLLEDSETARDLVGSEPIPERLRAFAAYSLGFLGRRTAREDVRRYAIHHLQAALEQERDQALPDVAVAALLGLSLVPLERIDLTDAGGEPEPASASRMAGLRAVLGELRDTRADDPRLRDHAPAALARMLADLPAERRVDLFPTVAAPLADAGKRLRSERQTFRSGLAAALGEVASLGDGELGGDLRELLIELSDDANQEVRQVARFSIGRVAGRPGPGVDGLAGLEALSGWLLRDLTRGRSTDRAYAGLALGLAASGLEESNLTPPREWQRALEQELLSASRPDDRAALALALGLAADGRPGDSLAKAFEKAPEGELRARIAFAMGLAGAVAETERIEEWMATRQADRFAVGRALESLALLGRRDVLDRARVELANDPPLPRGIGLLDGLGQVGDAAVLPSVLAATERARPDLLRAAAARALGALADRDPTPWCQDLADVANVASRVGTLYDFGAGGLLDLIEY